MLLPAARSALASSWTILPVQVGRLLYAIIGDQNTRIRTCGSLLRLLLPPDRGDIPKWVAVLQPPVHIERLKFPNTEE